MQVQCSRDCKAVEESPIDLSLMLDLLFIKACMSETAIEILRALGRRMLMDNDDGIEVVRIMTFLLWLSVLASLSSRDDRLAQLYFKSSDGDHAVVFNSVSL